MSEVSTPARRHHDSVRSSRSRQSSAPNDELSYSSLADLVRDVPTSPLSAGSPHRRTFGWPLSPSPNASSIRLDAGPSEAKAKPGVDELSTWRLMTLTVAIAGAQVAWTIEQARCVGSFRHGRRCALRCSARTLRWLENRDGS